MTNLAIKKVIWVALSLTIIILVWFIYKLASAGFLDANHSISPANSGSVGEFIGGTIGLIISITTLIILFQTYFSQNKQHIDFQYANSIELLLSIHESIVKDIEKLEFGPHKGELAILTFNITNTPNVFIDRLNYIINSYRLLIHRCNQMIKSQGESSTFNLAEDLIARFYLSFYTKIVWVIIAEDKVDLTKPQPYKIYLSLKLGKHDDAAYFLDSFGLLAKETFEYLMEKKIIPKNDWKQEIMERINKFI